MATGTGRIIALLVAKRRDVSMFWSGGVGERLLPWYYATAIGRVPPKYVLAGCVVPEHDLDLVTLSTLPLEDVERLLDRGLEEHGKLLEEAFWTSQGAEKYLTEAYRNVVGSFNGGVPATLLDISARYLELLLNISGRCLLCPRECRRVSHGGRGACNVPYNAQVGDMFPIYVVQIHVGDEAPLVPSLAVYLPACNMRCIYCQNFDCAHHGLPLSRKYTQRSFIEGVRPLLENVRCVKWVGGEPTLWLVPMLRLFKMFIGARLVKSQVVDTNLLVNSKVAKIIAHMFDLVIPDYKYGNDECARELSILPKNVKYVETIKQNLNILLDAKANMLVRHLVLPSHVECCSIKIIRDIAHLMKSRTAPPPAGTVFNILDQYRPEFLVATCEKYRRYRRRIGREEILKVLEACRECGLDLPLAQLQVR